jgi:hypothetical protein
MKVEDFKVNLTFDVNQANHLLDLLQKLPYGEVYNAMEFIKKQIETQLVDPSEFEDHDTSPFAGEIEHPF